MACSVDVGHAQTTSQKQSFLKNSCSFIKPKPKKDDSEENDPDHRNVYHAVPRVEEWVEEPMVINNIQEYGIKRVEIGEPDGQSLEKVIMIVGASGTGKSTWINSLFNHILGVQWKDEFRFKLIEEPEREKGQAQSQTSSIIAYTIHRQPWFKVSFTLTIIDTPGFQDTKGMTRDREITGQIRKFFNSRGEHGIDRLDAVGFVANSSLPRLNPAQIQNFNSIQELYGNNLRGNIFMLLTFADDQKPQALHALNEAKVPYEKYFKFNNSAVFRRTDDKATNGIGYGIAKNYWKMGSDSFADFMEELQNVTTKSLSLSQDVLNDRQCLEDALQNIQQQQEQLLTTLQNLKNQQEALGKYQQEADKCTYTEIEQVMQERPTDRSRSAVNCRECQVSCVPSCVMPKYPLKGPDLEKVWIFVRKPTGKGKSPSKGVLACTKCPGKCKPEDHENKKVSYVYVKKRVTKTYEELKRTYEEAQGKAMDKEELIKECEDRIEEVREDLLNSVDQARACTANLKLIALKHNVSTSDYIDVMIKAEENKPGEDRMKRIEYLKDLKKKAELRKEIVKPTFDPIAKIESKFSFKEAKGKDGKTERIVTKKYVRRAAPRTKASP